MLINLIIALLILNPATPFFSNDSIFFQIADEKINQQVAPERVNPENLGVIVKAKKFVAIDLNSGKLLIQNKADEKQAIASITKLMTALVILDQSVDWQMPVVLNEADETWGAQPHIYRGEEVLFEDLWKTALVASDNNSIMAMIRALGISQARFVELMNEKAFDLKLENAEFFDPTGLDPRNQATALDVARLIYTAMQQDKIQQTVLQSNYTFTIINKDKLRRISNTDVLINSFLNSQTYGYKLIGGKTGYLPEAGYCLGVAIEKETKPILIVVLNSQDISSRFQDVKSIADWVYTNYKW